MREHKKTEEEQRKRIFDIFTKCRSETASGRLQVYCSSLIEQVFIWYRDYLHTREMGLEIMKVINRFVKDETISKVPQDQDGFFKYLSVSIKREKAGSQREYNENETIKIPKGQKRKLREVEDFIWMKESQLGRKLTVYECSESISKWFREQEFIDLFNAIKLNAINKGRISYIDNGSFTILPLAGITNADSISYTGNSGNSEIDVLHEDYIKKTDMETRREAVKSFLDKKQKRSRDCYRALYTLYCIENYKDFEGLCPVLDKNVIEACQNGKKRNQYEIYQEYHPKAKPSSAEAMASRNLAELLKEIETCLKEKNL